MTTELTTPEPDTLQGAIAEITRLHNDILASARTTLENAMRIGELLAGVKAGLKHGLWLPRLAEHAPFSERTARNYIRIFEERDRIKSARVPDLTKAYHLLGDCSGVINVHDEAAFGEAYRQMLERSAEWDKALESGDLAQIVAVLREAEEMERVWRDATCECERELGRCLIEARRLAVDLLCSPGVEARLVDESLKACERLGINEEVIAEVSRERP